MSVAESKKRFIQEMHPLSQVVYCMALFFLALLISHPLYLGALLLTSGIVVMTAGLGKEWLIYLKIGIFMMALIIALNALLSGAGSSIIYESPAIQGWGRITITAESVVYGLGMSLRLLVMMSALCLYNHAVHPDKTLRLLGSSGSKSILAIILAMRLFPLMHQDLRRIIDVQRCRGLKFKNVSWLKRIHNLVPVTGILLSSSLERSMQIGASMYARGYGSGPSSTYRQDLWRPRDILVMTASTAGLLLGLALMVNGEASYTYYPLLEPVRSDDLARASLMAAFYLAPSILYWGWHRCLYLQSKI